jgi:3-oxoacyl-[acyl-carrier-protein] synthase-3
MIGIVDIGYYLPESHTSNAERKEAFAIDDAFIDKKIGFRTLARKQAGEETSDLCIRAFEDLQSRRTIDPVDVDCVVVVTQNPDGHGIPHTSAVLHHGLGLKPGVAAFDVGLACTGYVYGLDIARSFMESNRFKTGLLFTADPYSKILDSSDRDTELLFGDAATCTLLGEDSVYSIGRPRYSTHGERRDAIAVDPSTGKLGMKGRDVYMFVIKNVPGEVRACLESAGLSTGDVELYLFHQGSRIMVESLARQLRLETDRAPFLAAETGNTVSSSIPLLLAGRLGGGPPRILISGFGVGLGAATVILERAQS